MARPQDTPRIPQEQAVDERQEQAKEMLDKRQPTVKDLPQTEEENILPPRQALINLRRHMLGVAESIEKVLQHSRR